MPEVLSARALCSLADVDAYIESATLAAHTDILTRLINAASEAIHRLAEREFKPLVAASHERLFAVAPARLREVFVGDLKAAPSAVAVRDTAGVSTTVALADVTALPLSRPSSEPITQLRLGSGVGLSDSDVLAVTGTWGFPAVPEDVRQACIVQVREWFVGDLSRFGEAFDAAGVMPEVPLRAMSRATRDVARSYRIPVIA